MKIGLCSDHAGFELKQYIEKLLKERGLDYAHPLAVAVEKGEVYPGIAVCGTGNGICMTLNKHQGVRAALCWNEEIARLCRAHNDANVLVLPGRFISTDEALRVIDIFLNTPFEGGRHLRRIQKIPIS